MKPNGNLAPRPSPAPGRPNPTARPNSSSAFRPNGPTGRPNVMRAIPPSATSDLIRISDGSKVGPYTKDAIQTALSGGLLTTAQAGYLRGALLQNPNLSTAERAAISAALQNDRDEKRRLAAVNNNGFPVPVVPSPIIVPPVVPAVLPVVPSGTEVVVAPPVPAVTFGMQIRQLFDGPAARAGLQPGDVILSIGGVPTPTAEVLGGVLQQATGAVEVVVLRNATGERESVVLTPEDGRIGVFSESVRVD
jgi:hypothetical protein